MSSVTCAMSTIALWCTVSAIKLCSSCRFSLQAEKGALAQPRSRSRSDHDLAPWSANKPCVSKKAAASGVRYRDGFPVVSKGEKIITVACKEEWDGGSSGKVYTKGKRGKGVV